MRALPIIFAVLLPLAAQAESFDVAPTTLDLTPGEAGLFYVANHGSHAVTVQLEPMDWTQGPQGDARAPSANLLVSPQFATIQPGSRQSVRVMARTDGAGEHPYRLMVSELPDASEGINGVHVLLQFSVPVFAGHDSHAKPSLSFSRVVENGKPVLEARNNGNQTVKLTRLAVNGVPQPGDGFYYVLPGSVKRLPGAITTGTVSARDERSGDDIGGDIGH